MNETFNLSTKYIPNEFITLTTNQKYEMLMAETTRSITNMITEIVLYSFIIGIIFGILATIIYFKVLKK